MSRGVGKSALLEYLAGRAPMAATDEALPGLTGRVITPASEGK